MRVSADLASTRMWLHVAVEHAGETQKLRADRSLPMEADKTVFLF